MGPVIAKGLKIKLKNKTIRIWHAGYEVNYGNAGYVKLFPWNGYYRRRLKEKLCWWIASKLPKRVALYAFCIVHGLSGDGPEKEGEYAKAFDLWIKTHGLKL